MEEAPVICGALCHLLIAELSMDGASSGRSRATLLDPRPSVRPSVRPPSSRPYRQGAHSSVASQRRHKLGGSS